MAKGNVVSRISGTLVLIALAGCGDSGEPSAQSDGSSGAGGFLPGGSGGGGSGGIPGGTAGAPPSTPPSSGGTGGNVVGGGAGTSAGTGGGMLGGAGGTPPVGGTSGMPPMGGASGMLAGMGGEGGSAGSAPASGEGCTPAPSGTFQTMTVTGTGPDGNYTIFRPATLGEGGFLHPPVAWGNGLGTTPDLYVAQLSDVASNGFVVIANPGTGSDPMVVRQGLEWLIAQGESGEYAGKLAKNCAGTIGYSMGGGAAVGSGAHPEVRAIVSIHGLQDAAEKASGPILLLTSEGDTFVTKSGFVQPCYDRSSVQPTMLASHTGGDHLDPIDAGGPDWEPAVAWLRYWLYGDQSKRAMFFGADCTLCGWPDVQKKNGVD